MPSFSAWVRTLDPAIRRSISDPKAWAGLLGLTVLLICLGAWVPGTRDFFRLDPTLPAAWLVPTFALGIVGGIAEQRGWLSGTWFGTLALVDSLLLQIFTWSLVTSSQLPGAGFMAVFPVLVASYHGHIYKGSVRYPWAIVTSMLAAIVAASFGQHLEIIGVAGLVAVGIATLLGAVAVTGHDASLEREALRAAVDAQILQEKVAESERIKEDLLQVHAHQHDARNTLSSVLINMQTLLRQLEAGHALGPALTEIVADLREGLSRLQSLLSQPKNGEPSPIEVVEVVPLIEGVLAEARACYPKVGLKCTNELASRDQISVCGGKLALNRVITNLVRNACEGNGRKSASQVEVCVRESEVSLEIAISDDGPGFTDEQLVRLPTFHSDKPGGTGLGLYTCERLVRASAGTLTRTNREPHGAVVRVFLPRGER